MVWYSHLLKNFPQFVMVHTIKCSGVINKAEVDVFLELSHFFNDPMDVGNLISVSSASSKSSLNIQKFTIHLLLKPAAAAAAAAKSLQSCLTLCSPIDSSPPGSPIPGILQARTLEWAAFSPTLCQSPC